MTLPIGARLGPYEITAAIGAGGMGEVYRARDARLARDVAVKVLPHGVAADAERLRRFEQEARSAGMLNHPAILAIYDVGAHDGSPYLVSELLEGETLRSRLMEGPLSSRKAIELAAQIASGLAAAHGKGIVHRDIKPENLFITREGRAKILDFGLAKLTVSGLRSGDQANPPTMTVATEPGAVLGTVGYMSPEQVRGFPAEPRSDIFAVGTILYEMLSARRAFHGASSVETMNAILKEEPAPLSESVADLPPALERIVIHCLEKHPEERFQSAHDLAFALEGLSGISGKAAVGIAGASVPSPSTGPPAYRQITFRRGAILSARFAPGAHTIVYGAAWDGQPMRIFSARSESPVSLPLALPDADILAVSSKGELAISVRHKHLVGGHLSAGTLARVSLSGGAPRESLEGVYSADWSPGGEALAIVRQVEARVRLEFPIGTTLHESSGWIAEPRISPAGDLIAFIDHSDWGNINGPLTVVDLSGRSRVLSRGEGNVGGLAWHPSGKEVWFTDRDCLRAVSLSGEERLVARVPGVQKLLDISLDCVALVTRQIHRVGTIGRAPGGGADVDLSWIDWSLASDLTADGKTLLFDDHGPGSGEKPGVYIRGTDGSPAIRLGDGIARSFTPDGRWVLAIQFEGSRQRAVLLPIGVGEPRVLSEDGTNHQSTTLFPDGKRLLIAGNEPGRPIRMFVRDLEGGEAHPITPEGVYFRGRRKPVSPDGKHVVVRDSEGKGWIYPVEAGDPLPVPGIGPDDTPLCWSADGRSLYIFQMGELPARVHKLDLSTGRRKLWKELTPPDPAGILSYASIILTPDSKSYAYSYVRLLSELYLVDGLR